VSPGTGEEVKLVLRADVATNRIIAFGTPHMIARVEALVETLDLPIPQVELEVIMVSLSEGDSLKLGVELAGAFENGQTSVGLASLFGVGTQGGGEEGAELLNRAIDLAAEGFAGSVIHPGNFAAMVEALEKVSGAENISRATLIVTNNGTANLEGVVQQPVSSVNSNTQVVTTSFQGTSDAGTQVTLTPQIAAGDVVTLSYSISQSNFIDSPTVTPDGAAIPPARRNDTVSSSATIPDSFVIALGGLSAQSDRRGESRIPLLGRIPLLEHLFKVQSTERTDDRFYVFIRANILRRSDFAGLKHLSEEALRESNLVGEDWPALTPVMME
jgi:general secretion pathway protein D